VDFDQKKQEKSASPLKEELFHCGILGEANRTLESIYSLRFPAEPLQQVSADRPIRLISRDGSKTYPIQCGEPRVRSVHLGHCRSVSGSRAESWRDADQLFIEQHDRVPLNPAAVGSFSMDRLNRGLELKAAHAAASRRFSEMAFGFLY
jgi:hypothetical protein